MRTRLGLTAAATVLLAFVLAIGMRGDSHAAAQTPQGLAGYIVVLRDAVPNADGEIDQIERQQSFRAGLRFHSALKGFAAQLTPTQVQAIGRLPWVEFVSPDYEVHAVG